MKQFTNSLRGRLPVEREMRSILVVFCFPPLQLSSKIPFMSEVLPSVKLLSVGLVAPLYLAVHFWAARQEMWAG